MKVSSTTTGTILASFFVAASPTDAQGYGSRPLFAVSRFSAGATPHSSIGYIELTWSYSPGANASTCRASPATYQVFPSVEQTPCNDPATSFNLTMRADGGADLELWYEPRSGASAYGIHGIKAEEIVWANQESPTGIVQVYAGMQNFTVRAIHPEVRNTVSLGF
ncbi:Uu.00g025590.m01.CDS01 [Anthostomella pinea]|uniref:Uu.00g025590.m01.CDS01 n=1 Tax=Anthostomella pinea TaxID=933095 RepID=A0AAI8V8D9_9PEZI|nr:Uu.00g025590.m01.CDS01 [Anthostomella pinea]